MHSGLDLVCLPLGRSVRGSGGLGDCDPELGPVGQMRLIF